MANGAFKFKDNSGNVVASIGSNGSNIVITGGTLDLSGISGLTLGAITMSGTTQNATSASHAASYLLTSSFNSYSGTTNTIIGSLQTSTGSLNTFTSSADSRLTSIENTTSSLSNRVSSIEGVTGSYATTGSNTFNGNLTVTGYIDAQELRTTYISSSILYRSGSTKFGDESTDTHNFTGSVAISGSLNYTYNNNGSGIVINRNVAGTIYEIGSIKNSGSDIVYQGTGAVGIYADSNSDSTSEGRVVKLGNRGVAYLTVASNGDTTVSGSLTTTGNIIINSDGMSIDRTTSGEAYLFFRKSGTIRGSIYGRDSADGLRIFAGTSTLVQTITPTGLSVTGSIETTGTINGLSIPNDLFAQQFLLMGA